MLSKDIFGFTSGSLVTNTQTLGSTILRPIVAANTAACDPLFITLPQLKKVKIKTNTIINHYFLFFQHNSSGYRMFD